MRFLGLANCADDLIDYFRSYSVVELIIDGNYCIKYIISLKLISIYKYGTHLDE